MTPRLPHHLVVDVLEGHWREDSVTHEPPKTVDISIYHSLEGADTWWIQAPRDVARRVPAEPIWTSNLQVCVYCVGYRARIP